MLPEQQQRILGYFIEEARDHLNTIEQGLLNLEGTLNDPEMISEVFRAAHSIKGGAAMLGLTSIQHTSHRLEDCFKVLKDNPVQIDQKLESLFLGVSDTLKALLEQLSGPYGLSEDAANTLMSEAEPVFKWLYQHLELLVEQGKNGVASTTERHTTSVENVSTLTELFLRRDIPSLSEDTHQESTEISFSVAPQEVRNAARSPLTAKENNNWGEFQAQVLQRLREMLQLFKQTTTPSTRQNLQQCCYQLVRLGETWNLSKWCGLCQAAASAIGNSENSYLTLAKIVITEIKQAQELVLQGREAEIAISQQLEALLNFAEIELLEVTTDLFDEQSTALTESSTASELILSDNTEPLVITNIAQTTEELNLNEDTSDRTALAKPRASGYANVKGDRAYVQQGIPLNAATHTSLSFTTHDEVHPISSNLDSNGPEVGIAELNTLADLFDGNTPELDESWHQEETLDIVATDDFGIDFSSTDAEDANSDLSDFLSFDEGTSNEQHPKTTVTTEDLSLLFGDNFLEKENSESQNQQTSATTLELSDINVLDINLDSSSQDLQEFIDVSSDTDLPHDVNKNDVVEDLLTLTLDDDIELLPTGEVTQPETEANASVELSSNQKNSFDNLFLETRNANWVEEITPSDYIELPQETGLSLDSLFAEMEEQPLLATSEPELGDLFDTSPATAPEFSQSENDLSDFWNQETTEEQDEFDSLIEQNVERALEESLFAATNDIFSDSQQPIPSPVASFDIEEDFDLNFQHQEQLDLIFSSDSGDDLFDELTPSNPTISPAISDRIQPFAPETSLLAQDLGEEMIKRSQQPETLDFVPEFTNQPPEISAVDLELDSFNPFDENSQLLFEDVAASTYIQMETTENTVDVSSIENSLDNSFGETSDLASLQAQ
ncbi:Hpt domain-containing protein, partial [Nostoc sp. CCCryo 231-06]|nr:Hpt domain-containing protein [Nostoc sp. CCCryo 231-06]